MKYLWSPQKKLEKLFDQELINNLTGLDVITERNQSTEMSEADLKELRFETPFQVTPNVVTARGSRTRANSLNELSTLSGKCPLSDHNSQSNSCIFIETVY